MPGRRPQTNHYVALLRGINVGGNCRVEMSKLRQVCTDLGLSNVRTYINSGNVLFSSPQSAASILRELGPALNKKFLFNIPTILRSKQELETVINAVPKAWTNDSRQRTDVLFLWPEYNRPSTLQLIAQTPKVDVLRNAPGAIIWHFDRRFYTKTAMRKFIGTPVYNHMTARNINTVRTLASMLAEM